MFIIPLLKTFFKSLTWNLPSDEKILYLTFDDGPIPEVTPWVLATLSRYNAKATFFCIGDNVQKHPEVYEQILKQEHSTGNHTMNHLNGWSTRNTEYYQNVSACQKLVQSNLFRPPYGKISLLQIHTLKKEFRIIMWNVLSMDYNNRISNTECLSRVLKHAKNGSIIVFHDSLKAKSHLYYALPEVLNHFSKKGYRFEKIQ